MKKIIILLLLASLISGCTPGSSQRTMTEKNAPKSTENYNEGEVVSRIVDLKMGQKPKVKPTGKNKESATSQPPAIPKPPTQAQQPKQIQLEELTKEHNQAIIKTNFGDITVSFYAQESPVTVNNFLNLAKKGFYDGTKFHRVIKDFMIQGGDPLSKDDDWSDDGTGGPEYRFQDEINAHKLVQGSLAMANSGPNTNGSQFFIITASSTPWLDGKHTNFGYVTGGMDVILKIEAVETNERNHPIEDVVVESVELVKSE